MTDDETREILERFLDAYLSDVTPGEEDTEDMAECLVLWLKRKGLRIS